MFCELVKPDPDIFLKDNLTITYSSSYNEVSSFCEQ